MIYLLSGEGLEALRRMASRSVLYAFDFDGTLAQLSPDRENVGLSPTMHEWLRKLAQRVSCAIVSGRALSDLAPRVSGAVPYLIGNHGMEGPFTPPAALSEMESICSDWIKQVEGQEGEPFKGAPVVIENKRYSLTLHCREVENSIDIKHALVRLANRLTPAPRLIFGKASLNLLPPGNGGKGKAALDLMRCLRCTGLFFIGDDDTDEAVFSLKNGLMMGVRVGRQPDSYVKYYLKCHGEVEDILRYLVRFLNEAREPNRSE